MSATDNPLLSEGFLPPFHLVRGEHVRPGVETILQRGREGIDAIAATPGIPTWESLVGPLDDLARWVEERLTPVNHLLSVAETPVLRAAYNEMLPEISAFWARLALHESLWTRLKEYADTDEARALTGLRRRHLDKMLLEFRRAGADLPPARRERFEALKVELSQLQQRFGEHVLDATAAWEYLVDDPERLEGVPSGAVRRFRHTAGNQGVEGYLLTLDYPAVEPILKYAHDRALRRRVFEAYSTRCRDGEHDNRDLILRILRLREELAATLGYDGYPDFVLEDRMAGSGKRAVEFERDLTERTRPYWERDAHQLAEHAGHLGLDALRPWDVAYVSESLRRAEYDIDDEALRPYFPLDSVQRGLFELVRRVFGLSVTPRTVEEAWHPDVRFYELRDENGLLLGAFYTDWFPRKEKRQGAWMHDFVSGGPTGDGGFEPHLGAICGNFTPPDGDAPALLTHREVQTLFHEFGHLLHHATSRVPIRARGGLNVAWDWVEVPSQLMENWTWEREALALFARHHETGESLPEDLLERLRRARRFQGGWAQMRQLGLGTVDLALHTRFAPQAGEASVDELMDFARSRFAEFSVDPDFANYHVLTSFGHLFSGGYAAGYYSYLWSEALEADAFTRFLEAGIFDRETGRAYLESILARGDSDEPEVLFREFMGRDPDATALLERNLGEAPAYEPSEASH